MELKSVRAKKISVHFLVLLGLLLSAQAFANSREEAKKLFSSLTGNTANKAIADKYEAMIAAGQVDAAARDIVESNKGFYNVTLKNFFTPMSNEEGTVFADLNDMTATLIGATRDEINFFRVFWDDILYQFDGILIKLDANGNLASGVPEKYRSLAPTNDWYYLADLDVAVPMYNRTKNNMYEFAQKANVPLGSRKYFKMTQQMSYTTRDQGAVAGIFSTRGWAKAYYEAGTNRASFAFFAQNFMCKDMAELSDTTVPDFRVTRDVDRTPGGSSQTYKTYCAGCHAGQDGLRGAFAYYDFVDGAMVYATHDTINPQGQQVVVGPVAPKINHNNLFPDGKITTSDSWINLWTEGQNEYIGWGDATFGNGAKSLGKMLGQTKQVRKCLTEKVFETVCIRKPTTETDKATVLTLQNQFDADGNMKNLFINAAIACMGE